MNTKDIIIACHCDKNHPPVMVHDNTINSEFTPTDYFNGVEYVDKNKYCKTWKDIPSNSVDEIWTIECPIYFLLMADTYENMEFVNDFFREFMRVLRPSGKIHIVYRNLIGNIPSDEVDYNINFHMNKMLKNKNEDVSISYNAIDELPYYVYKPRQKYVHNQHVIIFTKLSEEVRLNRFGGKRHCRKSLRKKRSKRKNKYSIRKYK
jgi:hypothetical protein